MKHIDAVTAATFTSTPENRPSYEVRKLLVQVDISAAGASIVPYVRLEPDMPWEPLAAISASGLTEFPPYPQIYFDMTGNVGTVSVATDYS